MADTIKRTDAYRLTPVMPTESARQADIVTMLQRHPAVAWVMRNNSGATRLKGAWINMYLLWPATRLLSVLGWRDVAITEGYPDLTVILRGGGVLLLEVKRGKQKRYAPSEKQQRFAELATAGVVPYAVVNTMEGAWEAVNLAVRSFNFGDSFDHHPGTN
jgi:hypothetical protein